MMSGFGPLHPRFAALIVPALLLAFEPRPAAKLSGPLNLAFAAAWTITLGTRLALWNLEVRPFARLIAGLPPHLRVRPVVFDRNSEAFPGLPAHLHLTAYYQVEKGGTQGYSFAMYPTSAVRYVTGYPVTMGQGQEWFPSTFFYEYEQGVYDIFLVHSYRDMSARIFALHEAEIGLVAREGDWRAYAVLSPPAVPTSPPIPGATP
jgi:hypothetical protein